MPGPRCVAEIPPNTPKNDAPGFAGGSSRSHADTFAASGAGFSCGCANAGIVANRMNNAPVILSKAKDLKLRNRVAFRDPSPSARLRMTNGSMNRDLARTVITHLDRDLDVRVLELLELPLRPLDQFNAGPGEKLGDPDLQPLPPIFGKAIAVDVNDRRRAGARTVVDDREGGPRDFCRNRDEHCPRREVDEGLSRAEVRDAMPDGVGRRPRRQRACW